MTYRLFQIAGILLFAYLGIWIIVGLHHSADDLFVSRPLPIGSAFQGNDQLPVEEFKNLYHEGNDLLEGLLERANKYRVIYKFVDWTGFALAASITLIAGFLGKITSPNESPSSIAKQLKSESESPSKVSDHEQSGQQVNNWKDRTQSQKKLLQIVAVLAACSSVSIALSSRLHSEVDQKIKNAVELSSALTLSRKTWFDAKTPEEALSSLGELKNKIIMLHD